MVLPILMSAEVRAALLLVALAAVHVRRDQIARYHAFKALSDTVDRQRYFQSWLRKSLLLCGVASLFGLLAVGRLDALSTMPPEFADVAASTSGYSDAAVLAAIVVLVALAIRGRPRCSGRRKMLCVGDIEPLLPWNSRELFWAVLLSLNAGVSEELFFRLLVPLLLTMITGQAGFALAVTCILFGLGHAYQGRAGVIGASAGAVLFTIVYLGSGSIWIAAGWHAATNLNCVLRPSLLAGMDRLYSLLRRSIGL